MCVDQDPKSIGETAQDIYQKLEKIKVVDELTSERHGHISSKIKLDLFLSENPLGVKVSVVDKSGDFTFADWGDDWEGWLVKDTAEEQFFFVYYLHSGTVGEPDCRSDYHFDKLKVNTTTRFEAI